MPLFRYRTYDSKGKAFVAYLESPSLSVAKRKLFESQTAYVKLQPVKKKAFKKIKTASVLEFTKELEQLLSAGLPLYESLQIIRKNFAKDALGLSIEKMIEDLSLGQSFSSSLKSMPGVFDELYCTLVEMGEQTGQLSCALKRLLSNLERKHEMQKKVWMAALYPIILACFATLVVGVLIYFIVPTIESLFDFNKLGPFSKSVLKTCQHLKHTLWMYALILCSLLLTLKVSLKNSAAATYMDTLKLRVPVLKSYVQSALSARFCEVMALLLKTQVPLSDSLHLAQHVLSNRVLKCATERAISKIIEGRPISEQLEHLRFFSPLVVRLITVAEQTGELAHAFEQAAQIMNADVEKKLQSMTTLLSPLALLVMAVVVGTIMVAILIPLTDINALLN